MKRILYVEDSVTAQRIFQRMFSPPHEVLIAATSSAAKALLDQAAFDLVVCDYLLAQGDAFDVITPVRMRSSPELLPIIAVSGSMDQALTARLLAAGANACVRKPLHNEDFRALVDGMLDHAYVQAGRSDVLTTACFQWVEQGQYHEFNPETGAHLRGSDRAEVSRRMLTMLRESRRNGTVLGQITQEPIERLSPHRSLVAHPPLLPCRRQLPVRLWRAAPSAARCRPLSHGRPQPGQPVGQARLQRKTRHVAQFRPRPVEA